MQLSEFGVISPMVGDNVSALLPALWPPLDWFKGRILQVTLTYAAKIHFSNRLDLSAATAQSTAWFLNILYSRSPSVKSKMRCKLLNTPATTDILCGIKWAYLSYELSLSQSHACAILNFDVSLFLQSDKWDGKFLTSKTRWLRAFTLLSSTVVSELNKTAWREAKSKSWRFRLS